MLDTIEATPDVVQSERSTVDDVMAHSDNRTLNQQQIAAVRTRARRAFSDLEADSIVAAEISQR